MPSATPALPPIPWSAVPWVLWLGVLDWWAEVSRVTHEQALQQAVQTVSRRRHLPLRWLGALVLLGLLLLAAVKWVAAPALRDGALQAPPQTLLWESAGLASTITLLAVLWLVRRGVRSVTALYRRGAPAWHRRYRSRP